MHLSIILVIVYWFCYFVKHGMSSIIVPLFFTLMFIPKINLLQISSISTTGIRIDDFIALILLLNAILHSYTYKNSKIKWGINILLLISLSNLLSVFVGVIKGYDNRIFFSIMVILRRVEYFSFIFTGVYVAYKSKNFYKVFIREFTMLNIGYMIVAIMQLSGKCSYAVSGADTGGSIGRVAVSTFNGYYEYGQFLCFSCVVYLCDFLARRHYKSMIMLLMTLLMIFLTKSRTSLVSALLLMFLIIYLPIKERSTNALQISRILGIIIVISTIFFFFMGIFSIKNIGRFGTINIFELTANLYNNLTNNNFFTYAKMIRHNISETEMMERITDVSASMRFFKWGAAISGFRENIILGYGIGVTHVMDGNYIKLLAETGLLGFILWMKMYTHYMNICKRKIKDSLMIKSTYYMMMSTLIASVFIDMFEASKPMELLWFTIGAVLQTARKNESRRILWQDCYL